MCYREISFISYDILVCETKSCLASLFCYEKVGRVTHVPCMYLFTFEVISVDDKKRKLLTDAK